MRVHITLKRDACRDSVAVDRVRTSLASLGAHAVNEKRLRRYGILTADLDPDRLPELERMREIEGIEIDGPKRALG